jgi:hypothetical protein
LLLCCVWVSNLLTHNSRPQLSWKNRHEISVGMTLSRVEAIVGAPPTFHSERPGEDIEAYWVTGPIDQITMPREAYWVRAEGWVSDEAELTVLLDQNDKVWLTAINLQHRP